MSLAWLLVTALAAAEVAPPATVRAGQRVSLARKVRSKAARRLTGSWKITGYRVLDQQAYVEVAIPKERMDQTIETWLFRPDGTFRHQLDETLWATGRWSVQEAWRFQGGRYLLLHLEGVQSSLPGDRRDHMWHLVTFADEGRNLVVFQPAPKADRPKGLQQASVFERRPYGQR